MRVLIIEDEPLAQEELARLLGRNFPEMDVVAMLGSVEEAVEWLSELHADLVFMDIHLSDGVCFDIFDSVEVQAPIIFTTAYEQYAIQAFEVNGVGYVLKPLSESKLVDAVNRYQKRSIASEELSTLLDEIKRPRAYKSRIAIKLGDKISFVNMDDVAYFVADDRMTYVVQKSGKRQIVDYNIESLEMLLDPHVFFRVTRGCIASIGSIDKVSRHFNSRLKINLNPVYDKEILISRARSHEFVQWLDGE